jgi:hypothetical protein
MISDAEKPISEHLTHRRAPHKLCRTSSKCLRKRTNGNRMSSVTKGNGFYFIGRRWHGFLEWIHDCDSAERDLNGLCRSRDRRNVLAVWPSRTPGLTPPTLFIAVLCESHLPQDPILGSKIADFSVSAEESHVCVFPVTAFLSHTKQTRNKPDKRFLPNMCQRLGSLLQELWLVLSDLQEPRDPKPRRDTLAVFCVGYFCERIETHLYNFLQS